MLLATWGEFVSSLRHGIARSLVSLKSGRLFHRTRAFTHTHTHRERSDISSFSFSLESTIIFLTVRNTLFSLEAEEKEQPCTFIGDGTKRKIADKRLTRVFSLRVVFLACSAKKMITPLAVVGLFFLWEW